MFCKNCGNNLKEGVNFCNNCGEKAISLNNPNFAKQEIESSKKLPKWLKVILIILWVIIFAISMQVRKQFIVGALPGFIHTAIFLYLLNIIIKK